MMKKHFGRSSSEGAYQEAMEASAFCIQMATSDVKAVSRSSSTKGGRIDSGGGIGGSDGKLPPPPASLSSTTSCSTTTSIASNASGCDVDVDVDGDYSSDIDATSTNSFDDREGGTGTATNGTVTTNITTSNTIVEGTSIASMSSVSKDESSCSSLSGSCTDSDLDDEIEFLEEKKNILKRASEAMKREEAYTAFHARSIVAGESVSRAGSSLWEEARGILDVMRKEGDLDEWKDMPEVLSPIGNFKSCNGNQGLLLLDEQGVLRMDDLDLPINPTKRPKIDFSSVGKVTAKDHHLSAGGCRESSRKNGMVLQDSSLPASIVEATPILPHDSSSLGHWMTQAMVFQIPALAGPSSNSTNGMLDVYLDPNLGPLVVSPTHVPFQNAIQLAKALEITASAQIITMPTPPFAVVHINKAFCTMTGLSPAQVIGSPVEKVIQVVQEIPKVSMSDLQDADTRADLRGRFLLRPAGTKDVLRMCEVHVAPITDRSQESRGMSHVLVKIKPVEPTDEDIDEHATSSVSAHRSHSSNDSKDDLSPPASAAAKVFGAVG
mmetsp:Transcript_13963/g.33508  ORF Transcript_13963/g.33508 Transcript_13963/m.33508 type:complete len:550 (+) Transcript_13963:352-2001(+)